MFTIFVFNTQPKLHLKRTSSNQPRRRLFTSGSRRSFSQGGPQNSENCFNLCTPVMFLALVSPNPPRLETGPYSFSVWLSYVQITCRFVLDCTLQLLNCKPLTADRRVNRTGDFHFTFYMVVIASLIFWLPGFVAHIIDAYYCHFSSPTLHWFVNTPPSANSRTNLFLYSFTISILKVAL